MVEIIKSEEKRQPKIVLSAFKGMTDQLVAQATSARDGNFDIEPIERKHRQLVDDLPASIRTPLQAKTTELLADLRNTLTAVSCLKELTPSTRDKIVTFGERLAIHTASGYLIEANLKNRPLSGIEAGILTDSNFGNATILDKSLNLVRERLGPIPVPLIAGYFGHDEAGKIATLGRGGSDYIASYIASALRCECVLYKDVDGIMTADPKVVKNARRIREIDYLTAIELGRYGSKIIFEKAIAPAMKSGILIRVTSFAKSSEGTLITNGGRAAAVSILRNLSLITILGMPGLCTVASVLHELGSDHDADSPILTEVLRDEISLVAADSRVERMRELVKNLREGIAVKVRTGLALVAVMGQGFKASQIRETLQRNRIEALIVASAPSGRVICAVMNKEDAERSMNLLHDELQISREI